MHLFRAAVLAVAALVVSALGVTAQSTPTPQNDPTRVVDAFELARGAGDVDAALAQLADTAVITVQGQATRSYAGSAQLRTYMQSIGTRFQTVMRSRPLVEGSTVTWTERDEFAGQAVDCTVVAIVSAGHIAALTYRDSDPSGVPGRVAAMTTRPPTELPSATWPLALGVLGTGLLAGIFGWPRRKASRSELDGRMLVALRRERDLDRAA